MFRSRLHRLVPLAIGMLAALPATLIAEVAPIVIVDGKVGGFALKADSPQVTADKSPGGIEVKIAPGADGYPGLSITRADGKPFDLSAYGHLKAAIANTGSTDLDLGLRADNAGDWKDEPYNTENLILKPGQKADIHLIFGHSFGHKKGFALNSSAIVRLLVFTGKTETAKSFRIESITAGGEPGETPEADPASIRLVPDKGLIFKQGEERLPPLRLEGNGGAEPKLVPSEGIMIRLPGKGSEAAIRPEQGRWDLSRSLQVVVSIRNEGGSAASPSLRLESNGGPTALVPAGEIAAGASKDVAISFMAAEPWRGRPDFSGKGQGTTEGSGTPFGSDAVSAVVISGDRESIFTIRAIRATVPLPPKLPDWLGKRPPVDGDWRQTFKEEFDGQAVDAAKWNVHAANYWDKASWFSRDNVRVGGGVAKLRYEKRTGRHNDDPQGKEFHYATGLRDTYDKWTQRYGYFEVRVKLPTAPGLWPAFWLMPERGKEAGEQWQRQDTGNGGMEFDVVEHLTRWGPYRNNIAMHWDGYGEAHKHFGTDRIYMQPDEEGFITAGLLWLPGQAIYYINGSETARWESERISSVPSCLLFTLPQGGWDNSPIDDSKLPDHFVIDYVRIWQREDL